MLFVRAGTFMSKLERLAMRIAMHVPATLRKLRWSARQYSTRFP